MKTYDMALLSKRIMQAPWRCMTIIQLRDVLEIPHTSSLFKVIGRLVTAQVLAKVERDK